MRKCRLQFGLTVVEVLISVAILAILDAGMFTVSSYVSTQAEEKLAESTIEILVTSLEQFYEFWQEYPELLIIHDTPARRSALLFEKLHGTASSSRICGNIQESQTGDTDNDGKSEFLDAWGNAIDYTYTAGDEFAAVESAGADGDFSTQADNISSR